MGIISLTVKSLNGSSAGFPVTWALDTATFFQIAPAAAGADATITFEAQDVTTSKKRYDTITVDNTYASLVALGDENLIELNVSTRNGSATGFPAAWLFNKSTIMRVVPNGGGSTVTVAAIDVTTAKKSYDTFVVTESPSTIAAADDTLYVGTVVADEVQTDIINEKTAAAGVTIDSVLIKDGTVALNSTTQAVIFNADTNLDDYINSTDGNIQVTANGIGMFEFDGNNGKNLAKGMLAMENSSYLATENGTAVMSFGDSTGMKLTTATASIAAAGTAASGVANAMKAVVTITGLTAASGGSELVTLSGLTFLKTTDRLTSGIYEYTGTWVTNGIPMVSSVACNLDGTLTIIVTNVHGANALSGNLTVTVCWA